RHYSPPNPLPPPLLTTKPTTTTTTTRPPNPLVAESTSGRAKTAAESKAVSTAESTADRRCQQMLPGPTAVTVDVRIAPLHTMYPAVAWVALLTETQFDLRPHMERPENITPSEWDKYIEFWNDPRNIARAAQNRQNRAKSTVISRRDLVACSPSR
nr:hypothetical protein [Tanacetum cinerariifolium]